MWNIFKRKTIVLDTPIIRFELCHPLAKLPSKANRTDYGYDITVTDVTLKYNEANEPILIYKTGLKSEIPVGYVGIIAPRSSVFKKRLVLANSIGIIDAGYRDEWNILFKLTKPLTQSELETVARGEIPQKLGLYNIGERAAQVVFIKEDEVVLQTVSKVTADNNRGGGLGSTDNKQLTLQL